MTRLATMNKRRRRRSDLRIALRAVQGPCSDQLMMKRLSPSEWVDQYGRQWSSLRSVAPSPALTPVDYAQLDALRREMLGLPPEPMSDPARQAAARTERWPRGKLVILSTPV